jgi:hypothetical protein
MENGTPMFTAEEQKALVEEAGFIDVQVIPKWIDFGKFTNGTHSRKTGMLMKDLVAKRAGRAARYAYGSVFHVVAKYFKGNLTEEERHSFAQKAIEALRSGNEPDGICMLLPFSIHE